MTCMPQCGLKVMDNIIENVACTSDSDVLSRGKEEVEPTMVITPLQPRVRRRMHQPRPLHICMFQVQGMDDTTVPVTYNLYMSDML